MSRKSFTPKKERRDTLHRRRRSRSNFILWTTFVLAFFPSQLETTAACAFVHSNAIKNRRNLILSWPTKSHLWDDQTTVRLQSKWVQDRETAEQGTLTDTKHEGGVKRRLALISLAQTALLPPLLAQAASSSTPPLSLASSSEYLEHLALGTGRWSALDRAALSMGSSGQVPASFCTYAARLLLTYDKAVKSWWDQLELTYSLLPNDERRANLGKSFGSLARSVETSMDDLLSSSTSLSSTTTIKSDSHADSYGSLWDLFMDRYGSMEDAPRQIAILFALLPPNDQPKSKLQQMCSNKAASPDDNTAKLGASLTFLNENFTALLPKGYDCTLVEQQGSYFAVNPPVSLFQIGVDEEFGQTAIATLFGPLSENPLVRERPRFSLDTYALFGLAGATGCALTHTFVIPLDVVKTKNQVDPEGYKNFLGSAMRIAKEEGIDGLLLGAQATIAGYFWYGLSVYPSYTFFKRALSLSLLPPELATVHTNVIALAAGAMAAVIASLGLAPLESARIRAVAEPEIYRPIGLSGTLGVIATEDPSLGWKSLYAGLPSLLARQVIFGSVKFLAFERACDYIFANWPFLRDDTWTSLAVSLVAGGFSGVVSSIVSQPADSLLTYVAQSSEGSAGLGIAEGLLTMVKNEGPGALFRGLGSRCIWAGSIIAGQFLLYDVLRTFFGVNSDDLSQVYQILLPMR